MAGADAADGGAGVAWAEEEAALGVVGFVAVAGLVRGQHIDSVLRASAAATAADGVHGGGDFDPNGNLDTYANLHTHANKYTDTNPDTNTEPHTHTPVRSGRPCS